MQSVSIEPEISPPKILSVEGMSCASCAARIEKKLRSLPQIKDARVNFASQKAYLVFNEGMPITFPVIEKAVEQMGYRLAPLQHRSLDASNQKDTFQYAWRFILGGLISIPFLAMQISPLIGKEFLVPWVQFLLASIVYCVVGWPFHKITLRNLRHYQVTMDTLVSMGSSIAFWASIPAIFNVRFPMYFDSTILILTFIVHKQCPADLSESLFPKKALHSFNTRDSSLLKSLMGSLDFFFLFLFFNPINFFHLFQMCSLVSC